MEYMYHSMVSFKKLDEGIYQIAKNKWTNKRGYVTTSYVVDTLNTVEKVAIYDNRLVFLYANFDLESDR